MLKLAIIGTRGIPNHYGGFEQFAEYLAVGLVEHGHEVSVYNSHNHPYAENIFKGVNIIHKYDPEYKLGTVGQFIYDLNCIRDCRKRNFDIILQLGYTSSSVWSRILPCKSIIITNMDGLEWKRTKYSKPVQAFLKRAEWWAVKSSDLLIADSEGIQSYLRNKYKRKSVFIPYGATLPENINEETIKEFCLEKNRYFLLIARMEPENNIERILDGYAMSNANYPIVVIGKTENNYGKYLLEKYKEYSNIKFSGSIYDQSKLNDLRAFSDLYFHGHSVGGTNPSLLEAMASGCLICAHDNEFNRSVLQNDAYYFKESIDIKELLKANNNKSKIKAELMIQNNIQKIEDKYNWQNIIEQYAEIFKKVISEGKKKK